MRSSSFLDPSGPIPNQPSRRPGRRDLARLAGLALLSAGAGLALAAALQAPGVVVPKPGPRRYGPAYRHRDAR